MTQFQPGHSGNPSGRPKGVKDRRTLFAETIDSHKVNLLNKAIHMALEGNEQMLKLLLDRLLPAKPKDDIIDIHFDGNTIAEKSDQIINEILKQNLTPSEAMEMMKTLAFHAKILETYHLKQMLDELKEKMDQLEKNN